jgi:hypothetical protein
VIAIVPRPTHRHDEAPPSLLALHRLHLALVEFSDRLVKLELGEDVEEVGVDFVVDAAEVPISAFLIWSSLSSPF